LPYLTYIYQVINYYFHLHPGVISCGSKDKSLLSHFEERKRNNSFRNSIPFISERAYFISFGEIYNFLLSFGTSNCNPQSHRAPSLNCSLPKFQVTRSLRVGAAATLPLLPGSFNSYLMAGSFGSKERKIPSVRVSFKGWSWRGWSNLGHCRTIRQVGKNKQIR
jgi:hypothetical protein